jgi:hypothetical protein
MPDLPGVTYNGHFEGNALLAAADGTIVALRRAGEGSGIVVGDLEIGRVPAVDEIPRRYWLHRRGLLPAFAWNSQRLHGRRWYRRHVRAAPQPTGGRAPVADRRRSDSLPRSLR